jgi:hypothetical protein
VGNRGQQTITYGGTPIHGNPRLRKLLEDNGKGVAYERARRAQAAYLYFPGQDFHGSN